MRMNSTFLSVFVTLVLLYETSVSVLQAFSINLLLMFKIEISITHWVLTFLRSEHRRRMKESVFLKNDHLFSELARIV